MQIHIESVCVRAPIRCATYDRSGDQTHQSLCSFIMDHMSLDYEHQVQGDAAVPNMHELASDDEYTSTTLTLNDLSRTSTDITAEKHAAVGSWVDKTACNFDLQSKVSSTEQCHSVTSETGDERSTDSSGDSEAVRYDTQR